MFDILQEILQVQRYVTKVQNASCQWYGVKRIKPIFANKRNNETRFEAHLYYFKYSRSHFFNKTDLEQYFLRLLECIINPTYFRSRTRVSQVQLQLSKLKKDIAFCISLAL